MSDDEREDVGNGGDDAHAVNAVRNAEEAAERGADAGAPAGGAGVDDAVESEDVNATVTADAQEEEDATDAKAEGDATAAAEEDSDDEDEGIRRRRRKRAMALDEEDYELLEDNQVTGFKRKEKKKRIQTAAEREGATTAEPRAAGTIADLERGLFGEDDDEEAAGAEGEAPAEAVQAPEAPDAKRAVAYSDDDDSEDEMDDFIVRDETDGPKESKEERQRRLKSSIPGLRRDQLQDAADIFGDTEELHRMFARRNRVGGVAESQSVEDLAEDSSDGEDGEMDDFIENDDANAEDYERARAAAAERRAAKAEQKSARKSVGGPAEAKTWASKAFEPSVVKEQMLTAADDQIRETDIPERQQLKPRPASAPTDWEHEARWIYDRLMGVGSVQRGQPTPEGALLLRGAADYESEEARVNREYMLEQSMNELPAEEAEEIISSIVLFLKLTFEEHLEVPYIGTQRRDDMVLLLRGRYEEARRALDEDGGNYERLLRRFDVMYAILDWDDRYVRLELRKSRLAASFNAIAEAKADHEHGQVARQLINHLHYATMDHFVDDIEAKANLFFKEKLDGTSRRPQRRTDYDLHVAKGIRDLVKMSGPTAETLGESLFHYKDSDNLADVPPSELAKVYLDQGFTKIEHVMEAFVTVAATEIGAEPTIRNWLRDKFSEHATVSTHPTPQGTEIVDPWHPIAPIKRLKDVPLYKVTGEQFAYMMEGKRRGLLKVNIGFSKVRVEHTLQEMYTSYLSDNESALANEWNAVRKSILEKALNEHLLPAATRDFASMLGQDARDHMARTCSEGAWSYIYCAPWQPPRAEEEIDVRVVAAVAGSPATFVALDTAGELVDYIQCHTIGRNLGGPRAAGGAQMNSQQDELQALMNFVVQHRPHVCAVGAIGMDARRVYEVLTATVARIVEEQPRAIPEEVSVIAVEYVDDTVAKLCETASVVKSEMPEQTPVVLRAVALGRYMLNPAAVVASLVPGGEAGSLPMCPLQDAVLSKDDRVAIMERQLVTLVNQAGVDVNAVCAHPWMAGLLRYVAGLGPRKAAVVVNAVRSHEGGVIDNKVDLKPTLKDTVFRNAAAFLRVVGGDVLDSTRTHPDHYDKAEAIVQNALEVEDDMTTMDKYDKERLIEQCFQPKTWETKVAPLILEDYAGYLETEAGMGKLLEIVREIRVEMRYPFKEIRPPWVSLAPENLFSLLTGETPQTLAQGKLIHCTVKKIEGPRDGRQARAVCTLDSGLIGYVDKSDVSDNHVDRLEEKIQPGQVITARVAMDGIDIHNFTVQLVCSGRTLKPAETALWEEHMHAGERNPYYSMEIQDGELAPKKKAAAQKKKPAFIKRNIDHPYFQNIDPVAAQDKLKDADIGEVIIRPSSKGVRNLSCTMKMYDDIYKHIDIREGNKGSGVSNLGLGSPLIIDGEEYEDLDEVMARHVEPQVSLVKHMLRHRKFMGGTKDEVDAALKQQLARSPSIRPYALSVSYEYQGMFCMSYIRSSSGNVHHEYIVLTPAGFKYRKMVFPTVDRLLAFFKVNCAKPPPGHDPNPW